MRRRLTRLNTVIASALVAVCFTLSYGTLAQQPDSGPNGGPDNGAASISQKTAPQTDTPVAIEEAQPEPILDPGPAAADGGPRRIKRQDLIASVTIFVLAVFVGFEVITKVPPTLHTPLMSGSNAISGITIVGALIVASSVLGGFSNLVGFVAVTLATINAVGGFMVTHRMLAMFKKK